jgi:hypothetical protein
VVFLAVNTIFACEAVGPKQQACEIFETNPRYRLGRGLMYDRMQRWRLREVEIVGQRDRRCIGIDLVEKWLGVPIKEVS